MNLPNRLMSCAIFLFLASLFHSFSALAEFNPAGWSYYRDVIASPISEENAVILVHSDILEKAGTDLSDIRIVTQTNEIVPHKLFIQERIENPVSYPVKAARLSRSVGKWTDLWIDKGNKSLSAGLQFQTSSKDFVRKVEIRGSDNTRDYYVVSMDGLIADIRTQPPVSALSIKHPVNNFQFIHLRIIDGEAAPLKIDAINCIPSIEDSPFLKRQECKIVERKTDPASATTTIILDCGEKRFPVAGLTLSTPEQEFFKKAVIHFSSSQNEGSWKRADEQVIYRLAREDSHNENVSLLFNARTSRYIKLELTGGSPKVFPVDKIDMHMMMPVVFLPYNQNRKYRLFYGNTKAAPLPDVYVSRDALPLKSATHSLALGEEIAYVPPVRTATGGNSSTQTVPNTKTYSGLLGKTIGIIMLLAGLLLLFSVMLKAVSARKEDRRNSLK